VELKTLPVFADGRSAESTYICVARVDGSESLDFQDSHVSRKIQRVLFVPVVLERSDAQALEERRFGMPFLWEPTSEDIARLSSDFKHLQSMVRLGASDDIRGQEGEIMQLRPKAMSKRERTWGVSDEGWLVPVKPKAWYLRASFTSELIGRVYGRTLGETPQTAPRTGRARKKAEEAD
jgi:DNA mismatch repair protein MutH